MRKFLSRSGWSALIVVCLTQPASAEFGYAIGDGGASLLRFSTSAPGAVTRVGFFSGGDSFLDAIDFRPSTGQLFGYRDATDSYYTVDLNTGLLSKVSASPVGAPTNTFNLGMDFNPMIDRLRVVTDSTQNIVYNPVAGTAASQTALFYTAGDVNAGLVPVVIDNAYTNNIAGAASTQQYVLDYDLNVLATLNNNAGNLSTVGKVMLGGNVLDFNEFSGFDISTTGATNTAYALLTVGGTPGLYTLDLATGQATSLGSFGTAFGPIYSLAIQPVPEPASLVSLLLGGTVLAGLERWRRSRLGS